VGRGGRGRGRGDGGDGGGVAGEMGWFGAAVGCASSRSQQEVIIIPGAAPSSATGILSGENGD
jgi:hypothetical protein